MARADIIYGEPGDAGLVHNGSVNYTVQTAGGVFYNIYMDNSNDLVFRKSSDGITWSPSTVIFVGSIFQAAVWYDRWSNIAAGLIHLAYSETATDDVLYRSIDTESSDALGTQTTVFAGTSTNTNGALTIARARGGNLLCVYNIDGGTELGAAKSTDVGATWAAAADPWEATSDFVILLPGWAADDEDMMLIFWDRSAEEISRKLYDDSGDSWGETAIATAVDVVATATFPHFAAAVDIAGTRNVLVFWNGVDTANADLQCFTITESAITEVTAVVSNGTDDQGLCAIGIETVSGDWYVVYGGKSDGSETWSTAVNLYYKISTDDGATWGAETQLTTTARSLKTLFMPMRFATTFVASFWAVGTNNPTARISVALPSSGGGGMRMAGHGGLAA